MTLAKRVSQARMVLGYVCLNFSNPVCCVDWVNSKSLKAAASSRELDEYFCCTRSPVRGLTYFEIEYFDV